MGASGAWIIPSVTGAVEDIVDDLKGGGGVLLIVVFRLDQGATEREGEDTSKQSASTLRDCSNVGNSLLYG